MALATGRASTVDSSTGTRVGVCVNEDNGSDLLQGMIALGNKTTWSETSRTGLTGADAPTGGDMTTTGFAGTSGANLFDLGNAISTQVRATSSVASAVMTGRLAFYDSSNVCIGYSEQLSFTADATRRLGNASGDFIAQRQVVDNGIARKARFFVESISSGTWTAKCNPL